MLIQRQVHVGAAPGRVASVLERSPYRHALRIVPAGAGSQVLIEARIEPKALAEAMEIELLGVICAAKRRLESPTSGESIQKPIKRGRSTMTIIKRAVTINASSAEVWRALADFGNISVFNPSVKESRLTSDQPGGLGATRECVLAPVGVVQERITSWDEGRMMSIEIYDRKKIPGLRTGVATIEIDSRGERTDVSMSLDYEVGLGVLGASMNVIVMRRNFSKALAGLLAGLKHHVETGESVNGKTKVPVDEVSAIA